MTASEVVLGFDPGGQKSFGWAVCESIAGRLRVRKTGLTSNAVEAVTAVLPDSRVVAAGIDAPMFWGQTGSRTADDLVRKALAQRGHPNAPGTVQSVNSLWGACLVQGVLLGKMLHQHCPDAAITEAHPKALLWLLEIATPVRPERNVTLQDLSELVDVTEAKVSDHERDAVLAALAAWSMWRGSSDWRNLYEDEPDPVQPFGTPVSYWMPHL